jgi:hypothetical protein
VVADAYMQGTALRTSDTRNNPLLNKGATSSTLDRSRNQATVKYSNTQDNNYQGGVGQTYFQHNFNPVPPQSKNTYLQYGGAKLATKATAQQ